MCYPLYPLYPLYLLYPHSTSIIHFYPLYLYYIDLDRYAMFV